MSPRTRAVDRRVVRALVAHDLTAVRRTPGLVVPIAALPVVLLVIMPLAIAVAARDPSLEVGTYVDLVPERLAATVRGYPEEERLIILVLGYVMAPLFLIVPLMVSAVLAADSFAGERDRGTLETMLHTPIRDRELYLAKLLAAFVPALAVAWLGFALFAVVANVASWGIMGRVFLPTARWLVLVGWVAPASAALGLGLMVRLSIRARSAQEAQQLGSAVVLPILVVAVAQASYLLLYPVATSLAVGAGVWAVAIALNVRGANRFTRDHMATKV
ncbi:MAG TPA: ABC transporter permease subunit [Iamia sp.]|nr:ABC transporter permease subunit [Iamia sp.]